MAAIALLFLTLTPAEPARIDALVEAALREWDVPGAAIVIVSPQKVVHLKGYGVRELGGKDAVSADTLFPLASCSKAFTTAAVAALVDDGKLKWDDLVRKHLPDFHLSDAAADSLVTLRDLASHRTGVAGHDLLWYRSPWSQTELVRRVAKLPVSRSFRSEMQYQTIMYIALGQAAASAAGKPWDELVRERLLKPLGMRGASLTTTDASKDKGRALGHAIGKDGKLKSVPWYEQREPNPAGSVNATARDLVHWLQFHLNEGRVRDEQLISAESLRETHSPQTIIRVAGATKTLSPESYQISYGLGWVVQDYRGRLVVQHAGLIDGFRVHLTILPKDGYAFAILANREGTRMNLALSNTLVDHLVGLPVKDWNKYLQKVLSDEEAAANARARRTELGRRADAQPSLPLEKLAGEYEEAAYGVATIRAAKEGLTWEWGVWKLPLEHYADDTFRLKSDYAPLNGAFVRFIVKDGRRC